MARRNPKVSWSRPFRAGAEPWSPARVARLRELWSEGVSATEIADDLGGGVTRNGVIGKAHRLGLPPRESPIRTARPPEENGHVE